jgi:hypothetical protein
MKRRSPCPALLHAAEVLYDNGLVLTAEVTDATGHRLTVPGHIAHIRPAGPPATTLLPTIAPAQMPGFPKLDRAALASALAPALALAASVAAIP